MTKHIILFLSANPFGVNRPARYQEVRAIQAELERRGHRDQFELVTQWAVPPLDWLRELRSRRPTIVHFSDHGGRSATGATSGITRDVTTGAEGAGSEPVGGLLSRGNDGRPQLVPTRAIEEAFSAAGGTVKVVVLNACHSAAQVEALCTSVDCVVGIDGAIGGDAARRFAGQFYSALGDHRSVGNAVQRGVAVLAPYHLPDERLPRCVARHGVDPNQVFLHDAWRKSFEGVKGQEIPRAGRATDQIGPNLIRRRSRADLFLDDDSFRTPERRDDQPHGPGALREPAWRVAAPHARQASRDAGAATQDPFVGKVIDGRYEIQARLGEGGMSVVYKACEITINRVVALKLLSTQMAGDPTSVQRLHDAAKPYTRLQHPNTIRMFEFGQTNDGRLFMTMELVDGVSLREELRERPLAPHRVMEILIQCCASLAEAHSIGIIHRDIKPDNVFLLDRPGSPDFVKLDFSITELLERHRMTTQSGVVFGTLPYMSPEQLQGLPLDARSDLYALGILAFELLTGSVPFRAETPTTVIEMHLHVPAPPLPQSIPNSVQQVVRRALEKAPARRYQSAGEMMRHCQHALEGTRQLIVEAPPFAFGLGLSPALVADRAAVATNPTPSRTSRGGRTLDALEQLGEGPWREIAAAIHDTIQMKHDHELTMPELVEFAEHRGFAWRDVHVVIEKLAERGGFLERRFLSLHQDPPVVVSPDEVASRLRAGQANELAQAAWRKWAHEVKVVWRRRQPAEVTRGTP